MLNENAKKWVAALRSGQYEQGKHCLKTADGKFCCLGVAIEVAQANGVVRKGVPEVNYLRGEFEAVRVWLGLANHEGNYRTGALAEQNDRGVTFTEIADIIESEPEGLFVHEPA